MRNLTIAETPPTADNSALGKLSKQSLTSGTRYCGRARSAPTHLDLAAGDVLDRQALGGELVADSVGAGEVYAAEQLEPDRDSVPPGHSRELLSVLGARLGISAWRA